MSAPFPVPMIEQERFSLWPVDTQTVTRSLRSTKKSDTRPGTSSALDDLGRAVNAASSSTSMRGVLHMELPPFRIVLMIHLRPIKITQRGGTRIKAIPLRVACGALLDVVRISGVVTRPFGNARASAGRSASPGGFNATIRTAEFAQEAT